MALRTCCQKRLVINKIKPHICIILKFAQKGNILVYLVWLQKRFTCVIMKFSLKSSTLFLHVWLDPAGSVDYSPALIPSPLPYKTSLRFIRGVWVKHPPLATPPSLIGQLWAIYGILIPVDTHIYPL